MEILQSAVTQENWELPWAAGFFDGEGCVLIMKRRIKNMISPRYQMGVRVGNTNETIIRWFKEKFGGTISIQYIDGPKKPCYHWIINGPSAVLFLNQILPYLKLKVRQAELGLEMQARIKHGSERKYRSLTPIEIQEREIIYRQAKVLNEKGKVAFGSGLQLSAKF